MKKSNHLVHRMTGMNRSKRRRIFMRAIKERRMARQEIFFLFEEGRK